jgi:hypothetical protein
VILADGRRLKKRRRRASAPTVRCGNAKLAAVREGRIRVIINLPLRHLKSHLASVAFPAWCPGHGSRHPDPLRHPRVLRATVRRKRGPGAGPRRQAVVRPPAHPCQRLVSTDLGDPPLGATARGVRVRHHGPGLPARRLGRWRADRADTPSRACDATFCRIGCSLGMIDDCRSEDHKRSARMACRESRRLIGETRRVINESRRIIEETHRLMKDGRRGVAARAP